MAWRLARSLVVLRNEVRALHPGTTVWDIGDAAHQASASDHNPNAAGVVCATDTLGNAGLNLGWYAERVRLAGVNGHPAPKYVIFNRRIASRSQGWRWRTYNGSNPHTSHVHVSVGTGPDGQSTGPYDNTSPWGLIEEDDMPLTNEDLNKVADRVYRKFSQAVGRDHRAAVAGTFEVGYVVTPATAHRESWAYGKENKVLLRTLTGKVDALTVLVQQLATLPAVPLTDEQFAELLARVEAAAAGGAEVAIDRP